MSEESTNLIPSCQICGGKADLTWPGSLQDLSLCTRCAMSQLPCILAEAVYGQVAPEHRWPAAGRGFNYVRYRFWSHYDTLMPEDPYGLWEVTEAYASLEPRKEPDPLDF
jgi:hypothetical protein